jgi:hypothetical protein
LSVSLFVTLNVALERTDLNGLQAIDQGFSTLSKVKAAVTLTYQLADYSVTNDGSSLKLHGSVLKTVLTYVSIANRFTFFFPPVALQSFLDLDRLTYSRFLGLQTGLHVTQFSSTKSVISGLFDSLLLLEQPFNMKFNFFCYDLHASLQVLSVRHVLDLDLTFFIKLNSCSQ